MSVYQVFYDLSANFRNLLLLSYFDGGFHFDIALIKMEEPVPLTEFIMPICLKRYVTQKRGTFDCYSAGWGKNTKSDSTRQAHQLTVEKIY